MYTTHSIQLNIGISATSLSMGMMVKTRIPRIEKSSSLKAAGNARGGGGTLRGRRGIPGVVTSKRWAPLLYPHKMWITKSLWELTWGCCARIGTFITTAVD